MSATKLSPKLKCLEARTLLLEVEFVRTSCDVIADNSKKDLDRLQFRAENLAGEAGYDAALNGEECCVPACIQPYRVLKNAFIAEYALVINHLRFEALESAAISA